MTDRFKFRVWGKVFNWYWTDEEIKKNVAWLLFPDNDNINNVEIEQCTGLKDKNGKLIYENDVVRDTIIESGVIEWNEYHACFMVVFNDGDNREFGELDTKDFEIIGNIHENEKEKYI